MGASIVARCNPPPVFDPGEAVFNFVPLFVKRLIVSLRLPAVLFGRDAGLDAPFDQGFAEGIAVIALVAG